MLGFIAAIPRPEPPSRLEERLRKMTPDERDQHAQQLYKDVIERLQQDDAKEEARRMGITLIEHEPGGADGRSATANGAAASIPRNPGRNGAGSEN